MFISPGSRPGRGAASIRNFPRGGGLQDLSVGVPPLYSWTQENLSGSATFGFVEVPERSIIIKDTGSTTNQLFGLSRPAPATPYTVAAFAQFTAPNISWKRMWWGWKSSTGKFHAITVPTGNNIDHINEETWNTATSRNAVNIDVAEGQYAEAAGIWLVINDDGTNLKLGLSCDGVTWYPSLSTTHAADTFMPDWQNVAFGIDPESGPTQPIAMRMLAYDPFFGARVYT